MNKRHLEVLSRLFMTSKLRRSQGVNDKNPPDLGIAIVTDNTGLSAPLAQPCIFDKVEMDHCMKLLSNNKSSEISRSGDDLYPGRNESQSEQKFDSKGRAAYKLGSNRTVSINVLTKFMKDSKAVNTLMAVNVKNLLIIDDVNDKMFDVIEIDDFDKKTAEELKDAVDLFGVRSFSFSTLESFKSAVKNVFTLAKSYKYKTMEYLHTMNGMRLSKDTVFTVELFDVSNALPILNSRKVDGILCHLRVIDPNAGDIINVVLVFSNFQENVYVVDGCKTKPGFDSFNQKYVLDPIASLSMRKAADKKLVKEEESVKIVLPHDALRGIRIPNGATVDERPDGMVEVLLPPGVESLGGMVKELEKGKNDYIQINGYGDAPAENLWGELGAELDAAAAEDASDVIQKVLGKRKSKKKPAAKRKSFSGMVEALEPAQDNNYKVDVSAEIIDVGNDD